jgi:isopenicillin N synthase-like dioxygenase
MNMNEVLVFLAVWISKCLAAMNEAVEILHLDVISYESFINDDELALGTLRSALYDKGIVGIKGVPGYKEKVLQMIDTVISFSALPKEIKSKYSPDRLAGEWTGYELGVEKFKRPDGQWMVDTLKASYYANIPDDASNRWPSELDLRGPFQSLGKIMGDMGKSVMTKIGLIEPNGLDGTPQVGRLLHYRKNGGDHVNPFWCGAHYDHGMFTALLPAFYFVNEQSLEEPIECGLFVRNTDDGNFKKIIANDPDVLMFQVGEFGQLITNDRIRATEHRVQKATTGSVERYTMAVFFPAPNDLVIQSCSKLALDSRYPGGPGSPCTWDHWHRASLDRYLVKEEK